jgi:hypothetical protein
MVQDPRDKKYYQLQKRDISQLTRQDIVKYISYCEKMIEYSEAKNARRGWIDLKKELEEKLS